MSIVAAKLRKGIQGSRKNIERRIHHQETEAKDLLDTSPGLNDPSAVENLIRKLDEKESEIKNLAERYDALIDKLSENCADMDEDEYEADMEDMFEVSLNLSQICAKLRSFSKYLLAKVPVTLDATATPSSLEQQISRLVDGMDRSMHSTPVTLVTPGPSNYSNANNTVKLPKLEIKRFDGQLHLFREFWDKFWDRILEFFPKPRLQAVEKMNHLLTYLEGEARAVVAGLSVSNTNYHVAVDLIFERFGNTQVQLSALYAQQDNIAPPANNTTKLRQFYDKLEGIVRSLAAMNESVENEHLANRIHNKLPREILLTLERTKGMGVNWTVDLLRQRLHAEITARETVELASCESRSGHSSSQGTSKSTGHTRTGQALLGDSSSSEKGRSGSTSFNSNSSFNRNRAKTCVFCEGRHYSDKCRKYSSVKARKDRIRGRCFICLSDGHMLKDCTQTRPCYHCAVVGKHHQSLCLKKFGLKERELAAVADETSSEPNNVTSAPKSNTDNHVFQQQPHGAESGLLAAGGKVLLQTANVPVQKVGRQIPQSVKGILDCGCSRCCITTALAKQLALSSKMGDNITLNRFATVKTMNIQTDDAKIELIRKNENSMVISVSVVPRFTGLMHRTFVDLSCSYQMIRDLPLADTLPVMGENCHIDLLLGSDYYLDVITREKLFLQNGLWLRGSHLGWILSGRVPSCDFPPKESECSLLAILSHEMYETPFLPGPKEDLCRESFPNLEEFWALETIGKADPPHISDDDQALKRFNETIRFEGERYQVTWPWKKDAQYTLPDNFQLAYGRFQNLSRKFCQNADMFSKYRSIIQDQEVKGVIEKVNPETPTGPTKHYIPHHAVITPLKTTTKVRIIYDASAKTKKTNPSLNDCLYRGPVFLSDLVGLLMRFGLYNIAIISDIEKAFLQVGLQIPDRDVSRFFWFKDPTNPKPENNLQVYRFARVPFGIASNPFLLGATVDHLMQKIGTPLTETIRKNIYVDNVIIGAKSTNQAKDLYGEAKDAFGSASMN